MEVWVMIPNQGDRYEVSSIGRVRSVRRKVYCGGDAQWRTMKGKILKLATMNTGYKVAGFIDFNTKKVYPFLVHRLVAQAFFGINDDKMVNHKNGNKTDNRVENLEWCTCSENMLHACRTGLQRTAKGEEAGPAKTTTTDMYAIRERIANGDLPSIVGKDFGIAARTVRDMCNGSTWKHIDYLLTECKQQLSNRLKR